MVGTIDQKTLWCNTFKILKPAIVSEWNFIATKLQNSEWKHKIFKVLVARNCVYTSITGLIVGIIGTAVSHSKNNLRAEYSFAAVLGFSGLCTILFFKILKNKVEEHTNYLQGREAVPPPPPVVPSAVPATDSRTVVSVKVDCL